MRRRKKLFDAIGAPLDRPLEFARAPRDHRILRIQARLHAEAAADIADEHANFFKRYLQHLGAQRVAKTRRHLAACRDRDPIGRSVVAREQRARFDRTRRDALVDNIQRNDMGGATERSLRCRGAAVSRFRRDVVGRLVPDARRVGGHCAVEIGDCRKCVIANVDRVDRVLRLFARLREHHGNCFADKAHGADGERVVRRR